MGFSPPTGVFMGIIYMDFYYNMWDDMILSMSLVYTSLTAEKAEVEARRPAAKKLPKSYEKAIESPEGDLWGESMDREVKSLEEMKFGEIVDRPKDRKIMRCRWVYALKEDEKGKVTWYKSRTVLRE